MLYYAMLCYVDVEYFDILLRLLLIGPYAFYLVDHIEALDGASKDGVLVIKPWLVSLVS